jgi:hypothetical protein
LKKLEFIGRQPTGEGYKTYHKNGLKAFLAKNTGTMSPINVHKVEIWVERLKRFIG